MTGVVFSIPGNKFTQLLFSDVADLLITQTELTAAAGLECAANASAVRIHAEIFRMTFKINIRIHKCVKRMNRHILIRFDHRFSLEIAPVAAQKEIHRFFDFFRLLSGGRNIQNTGRK